MNDVAAADSPLLQREALLHALYEAAELEHNLMCTYLYAAFSLKDGGARGSARTGGGGGARAGGRCCSSVAIEEMGHLAAVWNITCGARRQPALRAHQLPARSRAACRRAWW